MQWVNQACIHPSRPPPKGPKCSATGSGWPSCRGCEDVARARAPHHSSCHSGASCGLRNSLPPIPVPPVGVGDWGIEGVEHMEDRAFPVAVPAQESASCIRTITEYQCRAGQDA